MAAWELCRHEKRVAVKTVDRTFLQGQSVELFRAAIKVKQRATRMEEG
jgi:hypothetical protein